MFKKTRRLLFTLMIAVLLVTPVFASVYTETFKTNTKKITMVKGEMLLPTIKGNKQSVKRTVTIKNEKTAKVVTSRNYIRALKKGTTSAVIKQGNKTLKVKLKVEDPKVVLADKKISLKGTTIKHKWKSSNPAVASVTGTGTITFKNSGSATLYTTIHGIKYQKNIYIVRNGSSFVIGKPGQSTGSATPTPAPVRYTTPTPTPVPEPAQEALTAVWLSATGTKFHSINNCGKMNPNNARLVSLEEALRQGYTPCSKCIG